MQECGECDLFKNKQCSGIQAGAFCTDMHGSETSLYHPANIDWQGPMSCEISDLYEKPAIIKARKDSEHDNDERNE